MAPPDSLPTLDGTSHPGAFRRILPLVARHLSSTPGLLALAALPVLFITARSMLAMRNTAYWDEIETVLDFLFGLHTAPSGTDVLAQLFSAGNEHRTLTSRLLFALSYWLTGTVNFIVIGVIGNLFIVGTGAVLIAAASDAIRRLHLTVVFAFLIFQLQHFENFFWSGSSIDHFQVVLLAVAALTALTRPTRPATLLAGLLAFLATFTLAHGLLVWPVGALLLARARRWPHLTLWAALAALALGGFFLGFSFNAGHAIGDFSAAGVGRIARFWLQLLGAPIALGDATLAPFLGAALLVILAAQLLQKNALDREPFAFPVALWAVGALLLIAIGRVDVVGGHVHSRYYVLGCLAWTMVALIQLNVWRDPARPRLALLRALPVLATFNLAANFSAAHDAYSWILCRDTAVEYFRHYGRDGVGPFHLSPLPDYTLQVTQRVEQAGIYRMPRMSYVREFPSARPVAHISYFIDRIPVADTLVAIEGWAGISGREAKPGQIHVVLQSDKSRHIFTTIAVERPDVASVHTSERWRHTGFRFQRRRWLLPPENFQIGLLIESGGKAEYVMTAHRLDLTGPGQGILAATN